MQSGNTILFRDWAHLFFGIGVFPLVRTFWWMWGLPCLPWIEPWSTIQLVGLTYVIALALLKIGAVTQVRKDRIARESYISQIKHSLGRIDGDEE